MGLFDWFKRVSRSEQKAYTTLNLARDIGWDYWTTPSQEVSTSNALQTIAIMRCVTLLSGVMSSFPLDVYRKTDSGRVPGRHRVDWLFNWEANDEQDARTAREQMFVNLLLSGSACALKIGDSTAGVRWLRPIPWQNIDWERTEGEIVYTVTDGGKTMTYSQREIFRVSLMSVDGLRGLSPIAQTRARLSAHKAAELHQASVYRNKPMPGMVLSFPETVGPDKAKEFQSALAEAYTQFQQGRPLVIGGGVKSEFPTIPLTDLQYLESLRYGEEQIARLYGIPPHMLGLTGKESNWGTGIEQNNIGFMQYTLLPLATTWEKAIRRQLFTEDEKRQGYYVKHNMAALLRGDLKSQAEALTLYVREGAMTPDEAREILDRNPHAGGVGAKPYMQAQMTPMDKLGQQPQPAAATNQ